MAKLPSLAQQPARFGQPAVQRQVIGGNNQAMTVEDIIAYMNLHEIRQSATFKNISEPVLKKMLRLVVNSGDRLTIADVCRLKESTTKTLGLTTSPENMKLDFSGLKSSKKKTQAAIEAIPESKFSSALTVVDATEQQLFTGVRAGDATNQTLADRNRRQKNLTNMMQKCPKVKIKKGTLLLHVTASSGAWLKESMVGQNNTHSYSFFTLYERGVAGAHANNFSAALVYSLTQDVYAFFMENYGMVAAEGSQQVYSADGKQQQVVSSVMKLGGEMATNLLDSMPLAQRPKAFISPSEHELVFFSGLIPSIMAKEGLVTRRDGSAKTAAGLVSAKGTGGDARRFEKFY
jgi:hypothetical protein